MQAAAVPRALWPVSALPRTSSCRPGALCRITLLQAQQEGVCGHPHQALPGCDVRRAIIRVLARAKQLAASGWQAGRGVRAGRTHVLAQPSSHGLRMVSGGYCGARARAAHIIRHGCGPRACGQCRRAIGLRVCAGLLRSLGHRGDLARACGGCAGVGGFQAAHNRLCLHCRRANGLEA